ncbi:MAG TPA: DUF4860 domain-containing protein [Candidatus Cottocaccamicrobium excrementipullorum]|nr:DUF4860 domain-containing protein [Candidatus Cottocaccamicrobium excrementipullorum]
MTEKDKDSSRRRKGAGSRREQAGSVNLLFTMLLFLGFVLCALFTVLIGGKVYENINRRSQENFTGSVALQYVANKIRQGDLEGAVSVRRMEGVPVLELQYSADGGNYVSWIYWYEGSIRELFFDPADGLGLSDGLPVLECDGFWAEQSADGRRITICTEGEGGGKLTLSLRCCGRTGNESEGQEAAEKKGEEG